MHRDNAAATIGTPKPVRVVFRLTEVIGVATLAAALIASAAAAFGFGLPLN